MSDRRAGISRKRSRCGRPSTSNNQREASDSSDDSDRRPTRRCYRERIHFGYHVITRAHINKLRLDVRKLKSHLIAARSRLIDLNVNSHKFKRNMKLYIKKMKILEKANAAKDPNESDPTPSENELEQMRRTADIIGRDTDEDTTSSFSSFSSSTFSATTSYSSYSCIKKRRGNFSFNLDHEDSSSDVY